MYSYRFTIIEWAEWCTSDTQVLWSDVKVERLHFSYRWFHTSQSTVASCLLLNIPEQRCFVKAARLTDSHEVLVTRCPTVMGRERSSECCRVHRLFGLATVLSVVVIACRIAKAQWGLICTLSPVLLQLSHHGHSRMIKYRGRMGAGWLKPAGCSLEEFFLLFFFFLPLPLLSLSHTPTEFVHSCTLQCDYNGERSGFMGTYVKPACRFRGLEQRQLKTKYIKFEIAGDCVPVCPVGSSIYHHVELVGQHINTETGSSPSFCLPHNLTNTVSPRWDYRASLIDFANLIFGSGQAGSWNEMATNAKGGLEACLAADDWEQRRHVKT